MVHVCVNSAAQDPRGGSRQSAGAAAGYATPSASSFSPEAQEGSEITSL